MVHGVTRPPFCLRTGLNAETTLVVVISKTFTTVRPPWQRWGRHRNSLVGKSGEGPLVICDESESGSLFETIASSVEAIAGWKTTEGLKGQNKGFVKIHLNELTSGSGENSLNR